MSLRVLLADADQLLLSLYGAFLADQRFAVRMASAVEDCLDLLRRWRPDVLVLDADLPGGSGLDVLTLMRNDPTVPTVPVLLLVSGQPITDEAVLIRDYALMIKPVPAVVLADVIRTLADSGWGETGMGATTENTRFGRLQASGQGLPASSAWARSTLSPRSRNL